MAAWQNEFGKVSSLAAWQDEIRKLAAWQYGRMKYHLTSVAYKRQKRNIKIKVKCSQIKKKIYLICKIRPLRSMNIRKDGISGESFNVGKRFISLNTCAGRANCRVV